MNKCALAALAALLLGCVLSAQAICAETNDGSSPEKAIKVPDIGNYANCKDFGAEYKKSIDQEYSYYLPILFGIQGKDWKVHGQRLITKDGKYYDQLQVLLLLLKKEKIVYFDITETYIKSTEAYNKQKNAKK